MAGLPSEEERRLAGRVGPADDHSVPSGHHRGLELARRVVDTASFEVREAGQVKAPVPDAAGDDHGGGDDVQLVVEPDAEPTAGHRRQPGDGAG